MPLITVSLARMKRWKVVVCCDTWRTEERAVMSGLKYFDNIHMKT
jgi:hypothetical protein